MKYDIDAHDVRSFDNLAATPRPEVWHGGLIAVARAREGDGPYDSGGLGNHKEHLAGWRATQGFVGHAG